MRAAAGTQPQIEDPARINSSFAGLIMQSGMQVHEVLAGLRHMLACQLKAGVLLPVKVHQLLPHFIAAGPYTGADRDQKRGGIAAIGLLHHRHRPGKNPCQGTTPAGMNRCHRARPRISNQDGKTVGNLNGHCDAAKRGGQRIALAALTSPPAITFFYDMNAVRVDLTERYEVGSVSPDGQKETPPILLNRMPRIPRDVAQIEKTRACTDTAAAGRKGVAQIGDLLKGPTHVEGDAVPLSPGKPVVPHASNTVPRFSLLSIVFRSHT